jgi:hypothetical protein
MSDRHATRLGDERSPFAPPAASLPHLHAEGPVRYLLVSGELDDTSWGIVGAFWLSIDGERGGFIVAPGSVWHGSEMVRSFRGALDRGWTDARIYAYWEGQAGSPGTYMVDPQEHADSLFSVARRVGAL